MNGQVLTVCWGNVDDSGGGKRKYEGGGQGGMVLTAPFKGAKCLFVRGLGADVTDADLEGVLPEVWICIYIYIYIYVTI
jgi:hypothetical protein